MDAPLSRRTLLVRAAAAAAVLGVPFLAACAKGGTAAGGATTAAGAATETSPGNLSVYVLDSEWGGCGGAGSRRSCRGCRACEVHAQNKLFATREAAEANRAHSGCRCLIGETTLPAAQWTGLFGPSGGPTRVAVDRRWETTRAVLA